MISANNQPNQFFRSQNDIVMMMAPQEFIPELLTAGGYYGPQPGRRNQTLISAAW
jgi:hypothetical protein